MLCTQNLTSYFHAAIKYGKLDTVKILIDLYGVSYFPIWLEGYSLLCVALSYNQEEVAKLLLAKGAKINNKNVKASNTPLHFAITNCNIEMVKMLLDKGSDIHAKNRHGRTPLYNAIEYEKIEIAELLLANGAVVNIRDSNNISPLDVATQKKHLEIMKRLLNCGAYINCEDSLPGDICWSPLHIAARYYNESVVTLLLNYGANINITGVNNITPIYFASEEGSEDAVALFLKNGAIVNACKNVKTTPLHIAAAKGHKSIVMLLLQHGGNVNDQDKFGRTVLYCAIENRYASIVQEVLSYCPDINRKINRKCLHAAIYDDAKESKIIVEALLGYGFRITPSDANNFALLDAAIKKGYFKIVESFLKYGADANNVYYSIHGQRLTYLHAAVQMQQEEMAELLILYGANINARDYAGKTPIFYAIDNNDVRMTYLLLINRANVIEYPELLCNAAKKNYIEIVKALLLYDIDLKYTDEIGRTALHLSILGSQDLNVKAKIAQLLLREGAYVDAETKEGVTALHMAIVKGYGEIVKILLEYNANANYVMIDGAGPLHIAAKIGFKEITENLLKFGADINSRDNCGRTALCIAILMSRGEVITTLLEYGADFTELIDSYKESVFPFIDTRMSYSFDSSYDKFCDDDSIGSNEDNDSIFGFFYSCSTLYKVKEMIFKRHLIKLQVANLYADKSILKYLKIYGMNNFKAECNKEITNMKFEKIDAKHSFYEILKKSISSLVKYMHNENTVEIFKSEEYKTKFPRYAGMIKSKIIRLMYRKHLETEANNIFHCLSNSIHELPYDCSEKIISYLDDRSIRVLIQACSLT